MPFPGGPLADWNRQPGMQPGVPLALQKPASAAAAFAPPPPPASAMLDPLPVSFPLQLQLPQRSGAVPEHSLRLPGGPGPQPQQPQLQRAVSPFLQQQAQVGGPTLRVVSSQPWA
jgi:hypothetical protein